MTNNDKPVTWKEMNLAARIMFVAILIPLMSLAMVILLAIVVKVVELCWAWVN